MPALPAPPTFVRHPDPAAWAALHAAAPQATVYTAGWWLDTVTARSWGAVVVPHGHGGYAAGLPVPLRRRWRGLGRTEIFQPFFTQQLGVLSLTDAAPNAAPFMAALPAGLRAYGQLHYTNQLASPPPDFTIGARLTHHLDLSPPYTTLAAGFHQNHRRNLKKATALLLSADFSAEGAAAPAVIELFRATKGRELSEVKSRHYALLHRLAAGLAARHQLTVVTARATTGELLAGGLFAHDTRQTIYLLGAVSDDGRARGAAHAVVDALIRREAGGAAAPGSPARLLDFEGSMVPSVARFYAGFGARPVPYVTFQRP